VLEKVGDFLILPTLGKCKNVIFTFARRWATTKRKISSLPSLGQTQKRKIQARPTLGNDKMLIFRLAQRRANAKTPFLLSKCQFCTKSLLL
jgi:hypothetical protein